MPPWLPPETGGSKKKGGGVHKNYLNRGKGKKRWGGISGQHEDRWGGERAPQGEEFEEFDEATRKGKKEGGKDGGLQGRGNKRRKKGKGRLTEPLSRAQNKTGGKTFGGGKIEKI